MKRPLSEVRALTAPPAKPNFCIDENILVIRLRGNSKINKLPEDERLLLICNPFDDNQWYLHLSIFENVLPTPVQAGESLWVKESLCFTYRDQPYISLPLIEQRKAERFKKIRRIAVFHIAMMIKARRTRDTEIDAVLMDGLNVLEKLL